MNGIRILIEDGDIDAYLKKHGLEHDVNLVEDAVLIPGGMVDGRPAVLLVGTIDGKKRVLKTSLRLLICASQAMNTRIEMELGPGWRGP